MLPKAEYCRGCATRRDGLGLQLETTLRESNPSRMIFHFSYTLLTSTVGAAVKGPVGFNPMTDDLAVTVITNWRQLVNRTLKAVERMARACRYDLERKIIVIPTYFTLCHFRVPRYCSVSSDGVHLQFEILQKRGRISELLSISYGQGSPSLTQFG